MARHARLKLETLNDRIAPAAGALDPTFGGDNKVVTSFGPGEDEAYSVALQADGKIVTAGRTYNGSNYDFAVARYRIDGTLDTSFDGDGKLTTVFGTGDDIANGVAVQSDGRIVVVGQSNLTSGDIALARYNADGSLDVTFGTGGKVTTDFGFVLDIANAVAIQPDGKIVIAGMSPGPTLDYDFCVVRYNPDGSLDTSFSGDGKVVATIGSNYDEAKSIALLPDGKIVVAGISHNGSNLDFALARFTTGGLLDNTFAGDGMVTLPFGTGDDYCRGVAVQPDGKIVAVGSGFTGSNNDYALARFNVDGSLDTSFAGDGTHTAAFGTIQDVATAVTVLPNGKILIAGSGFTGGTNGFAIARYNSNGTIDGTFGGGDGMDISTIGSSFSGAAALAMQTDGRIVLAGYSEVGLDKDFALLRYKADGSLDRLADGTGKVTTGIGSGIDGAYSVAVQADGKIVVAGISNNGSNYDFALARYNTDGSLDSSFDGDGKLTTAVGSGHDEANSVAIQADGKIVVAGFSHNGTNNDFALVRYNSNGILDNTFDGDGMVTTPIGTSNDVIYSLTIQADGRIVVAGVASNGANNDFAVARYNVNGSLDNTFDTDGKLTTAIGTQADDAWSVAVQPDGKIVVAGYSIGGSGEYLVAVARYNVNGSPDTLFDTDGKLTTDIGTSNDYGRSVAIQADGKIVVAGYSFTTPGVNADFAAVRYNSNGSLDTTFDTDGKVQTPMTGFSDFATAVAIQSDGKIVIAGNASTTDFGVVRYNANGSLDSTFDGDGKLITPVGNSGVSVSGMALQADGKIVVVGSSIVNNFDFAVARIRGDNHAPVVLPATMNLAEDTTLEITDPTYISEPDGDAFTTNVLAGPAHGTLNLTIYGTFTYAPDPDFYGTDSFSYKVKDLEGALDAGVVFFNVASANDDPTATDDSANIIANVGAQGISVVANDSILPDAGETLTITAVTQGLHGTVGIVSGTSVTYLPETGYAGPDSFTYTISDGNGGTATATVTVDVTAISSLTLSGVPVSRNINEGETVSFTATASGTNLTFSLDGAPPAASIDPNTGEFSWTTTEADGPDTFVFKVQVTDGSLSTEKTVTVIVAELNTAPILADVPANALKTRGETMSFIATSTDADLLNGLENTRTFSLVGAPADATIDPVTGMFSWLVSESQPLGTYNFEVRVADDGIPSKSDSLPISVTVHDAYLLNGDLVVGGTAGKDTITVNPSKDLSQIIVKLGKSTLAPFAANPVNRIVVRSLGGNDKITIHAKLAKPSNLYGGPGDDKITGGAGDDYLFGEAGRDILKGGAGRNVLVGGADNDVLTGGNDRDVLIGGAGADNLNGGSGLAEDLLIGGSTNFDTDLAGLTDIFTAWNQPLPVTYADRVDVLTPGGALNGTTQLSGLTAQDTANDTLTGAGGLDWFVKSDFDKLDLKPGETATTLTV